MVFIGLIIAYLNILYAQEFILVISGVLCCFVPAIAAYFAAGLGLLQYRSWARILAIILGIINLILFPIGTAVGLYTLIIMYNEETKVLFIEEVTPANFEAKQGRRHIMSEPVSKSQLEISNRLDTSKNIVGIINILGWIGLLLELVIGDFSLDSAVWAIAFSLGLVYWARARLFLASQEDKDLQTRQLDSMSKIFYAYIIAWILGGALSILIWANIDAATALGVILALVATFMMNRFQGNGKLLLMEAYSEAAQEVQGQQVAYAQPQQAAPAPQEDTLSQLERLGALKEQGVITEEEFQAQKAKILGT